MKALIIYDSIPLAIKAKSILQRADPDVNWTIEPWRSDMLKWPAAAAEALTKNEDAHLILFAGCHILTQAPWLRSWLEQWASRRQVQDAALAVIDGGSDEARSRLARDELSDIAQRHGLNLIAGSGQPIEARPITANPVSRKQRFPAILSPFGFGD